MKIKLVLLALMALVIVPLSVLTACSGEKVNNSVASKVIQATVTGDTVSIPAADVEKNINSKFTLSAGNNNISFMAYQYAGKTYVRADICPPCRSQSFTMVGDTLVCDTCGTVFKAEDGQGVRGACVNFPKAAVAFEKDGDKIVMSDTDLVDAYMATLERG